MNFFPGLYQTKRTKKTTSFSNPLTGSQFSNKDFLKNCSFVPRSSSHLQTVKDAQTIIENDEQIKGEKSFRLKKTFLNKQQRKRVERQIVAINATARLSQPTKYNGNKTLLNKKCMKALDIEDLNTFQNLKFNKTFDVNNQFQNKHRRAQSSRQIHSSFNTNSQSNIATFPNIKILVLDILNNINDLQTKIISINLQKYFRSFFKKKLSGHFTEEFLKKVQFYYEKLLEPIQKSHETVQRSHQLVQKSYQPVQRLHNNIQKLQQNRLQRINNIKSEREQIKFKIDQPIDDLLILQQKQLFSVVSRMSFLQKINQLQQRKSTSNLQKIQSMIKYFCVPQKQFRQSCLRDILLILSLEIFQKFNCNKHQEYVLMDQNGRIIDQIMKVRFTTTKLFITTKKNSQFNYHNYQQLLSDFYTQGRKLTFNQGIKHSFRRNIAKGSFDDTHFNYTQNHQLQSIKRRFQVKNAQNILKRRNQQYRLNKIILKEQNQQQSTCQQSRQQQQPQDDDKSKYSQNLENKQSSQFWKFQDKKISPEKKSNQSSRKQLSNGKKAQKSIQKQRKQLNQLLRKKVLISGRQVEFRQQFVWLYQKNDFLDISFNQSHKNLLLTQTLKQHLIYFKQHSSSQFNRIIKAIKNNNPGVQNKVPNTLSWQEYKNLRITIQCKENKDVQMGFVANYLRFNQYGEINKQLLYQEITFILGDNSDPNATQVILQVIWSWFQANSIIQNGVIRRIVLESWYQKYKIVYCLLISLIFGTNHTTALDLAYEIIL